MILDDLSRRLLQDCWRHPRAPLAPFHGPFCWSWRVVARERLVSSSWSAWGQPSKSRKSMVIHKIFTTFSHVSMVSSDPIGMPRPSKASCHVQNLQNSESTCRTWHRFDVRRVPDGPRPCEEERPRDLSILARGGQLPKSPTKLGQKMDRSYANWFLGGVGTWCRKSTISGWFVISPRDTMVLVHIYK